MIKNNSQKKADYSQMVVADFLTQNGFVLSEVNKPSANGIDIVAIKGGQHFLIEVKSVIKSSRSWRVKKPHPKCDYIAVVMPNSIIHFECASDWMRNCANDGTRSITGLVSLYQMFDSSQKISKWMDERVSKLEKLEG